MAVARRTLDSIFVSASEDCDSRSVAASSAFSCSVYRMALFCLLRASREFSRADLRVAQENVFAHSLLGRFRTCTGYWCFQVELIDSGTRLASSGVLEAVLW